MNLSRLRYLLSLTDGSPFNATTRQESVHQSFISRYSISSNTNISDVLKVITPSRPELVSAIFHKTPSRRCSVHQSCTSQMPSRAYTFYHSTPQRAENLSINVECLRHLSQHYQRLPSKPQGEVQWKHLPQTTSYTYIQDHTSSVQYQTAVALWPGWVPPKRYC